MDLVNRIRKLYFRIVINFKEDEENYRIDSRLYDDNGLFSY